MVMGDSGTDGVDVKALLYSVIERLGRDSLRSGLVRDSRSTISLILDSCMKELSSNRDGDTTLRLVTALMHYLLTECMIPSERKIQVDDMVLDLIIPSMRVLRSNPDNTLIILIARGDEVDALNQRLEKVYTLYPRVTLWAIVVGGSVDASRISNARVYMMDESADERSIPLSSIIEDIRGFMNSRGIRPFNIIA